MVSWVFETHWSRLLFFICIMAHHFLSCNRYPYWQWLGLSNSASLRDLVWRKRNCEKQVKTLLSDEIIWFFMAFPDVKMTVWSTVICLQKVDPEQLFTRQEKIGRGSFGEVFKGIDNRTGQVWKFMLNGLKTAFPILWFPSVSSNDGFRNLRS